MIWIRFQQQEFVMKTTEEIGYKKDVIKNVLMKTFMTIIRESMEDMDDDKKTYEQFEKEVKLRIQKNPS